MIRPCLASELCGGQCPQQQPAIAGQALEGQRGAVLLLLPGDGPHRPAVLPGLGGAAVARLARSPGIKDMHRAIPAAHCHQVRVLGVGVPRQSTWMAAFSAIVSTTALTLCRRSGNLSCSQARNKAPYPCCTDLLRACLIWCGKQILGGRDSSGRSQAPALSIASENRKCRKMPQRDHCSCSSSSRR